MITDISFVVMATNLYAYSLYRLGVSVNVKSLLLPVSMQIHTYIELRCEIDSP